MAEIPESPTPPVAPSPKPGQEFWALVALGAVALICFTLLAVGLALILSHNAASPAPIQISNIGNSAAPAASAPALAPGMPGIQRPSEPMKPQSERASAMDRTQPALPGVLASPTPPSSQRQVALTRADPPSPPSPPLPTPQPQPTVDPHKIYFRVRADPTNLYGGQKALPMPVRYVAGIDGKVSGVFASKDVSASADRFSYSPDVPFAESGVRGSLLDIQIGQPRKTSSVDGFRAPKGFQFFTAKLTLSDQGAVPVVLHVDDLEVHDTDGLRYLANPELVVGDWPEPSLAPGAEAQVEMSFLVPETSPLKELAVQEAPGQMAVVPLQAR